MIWFFIGLAVIPASLYLLLFYIQYKIRRYAIGNVWETTNGDIGIIIDHLQPNKEFYLVVEINKDENLLYNTNGERVVNYNGTKFKKHLGTKKQVPEYFL